MKKIFITIAALCLSCNLAWAEPASTASVKEFVALSKINQTFENILKQQETQLDQRLQNVISSGKADKKQIDAMKKFNEGIKKLLREELSPQKLEAIAVQIYQKNMTQQELTDVIAFYKTPSGKALLEKTPQVMQQIMTLTQQQQLALQPKIKQLEEALARDLQKK